ncbi:MAG: endonuclease/exonuclease/phosphatase family protein [Deltaproteobacteria bacterium]|nr:endonuclease/exonuclease/phosphatase family protein [Deltaproteobacteria bacterium]
MDSIRVVTLNLWNDREQPERRLEVVAEGLRALEPDVVALQEVREGPFVAQATTLARMLGLGSAFGVVDPSSPGGPVGNAVLSRYPIDSVQNHSLPSSPDDPRAALQARVRTPSTEVRVVSTHLSWEPQAAPRREEQVLALDEICQAPADAFVLLCGDFNTAPSAAVVRFLTGCDSLAGRGTFFRDAWARRHPSADGFTYSSTNPCAVRWIEQNRRIDYIFVRGPVLHHGERAVLDSRIVLDVPAADGTWPSDHFGVLAQIRLTPFPDSHRE